MVELTSYSHPFLANCSLKCQSCRAAVTMQIVSFREGWEYFIPCCTLGCMYIGAFPALWTPGDKQLKGDGLRWSLFFPWGQMKLSPAEIPPLYSHFTLTYPPSSFAKSWNRKKECAESSHILLVCGFVYIFSYFIIVKWVHFTWGAKVAQATSEPEPACCTFV